MYKKVNVVMLPTNEKAIPRDLVLSVNNNLRLLDVDKTGNFTKQHLYILSDEEIKEGDWCIGNDKIHAKSPDEFFIAQCTSVVNGWIYLEGHEGEGNNPDYTKKIIATTNTSLKFGEDFPGVIRYKTLPQPSQSFIEKYVAEYNKGNMITDVLVEYEECKPGMCKINNMTCGHSGCSKPFLKINPKDNTITIRKMKDSWSKKEQFEKIIKFRDDYEEFKKNCYFGPNKKEIDDWINNWIEQNL